MSNPDGLPPKSKYRYFRELHEDGHDSGIVDYDGAILYEAPYSALLNAIVRYNDVAKLAQYLQNHDHATDGHVEVPYLDPFYIAAQHGSTEALDLLFIHYNAHFTNIGRIPLEKREVQLLNVACSNARIETALYLLDTQLSLASLEAKDDSSVWQDYETPILSAADSFTYTPPGFNYDDLEIRAQPARAEGLMNQLLDRGASARDMLRSFCDNKHISDTVLSRAISRASYGLVKRLVAEGADVHVQIMQNISLFTGQPEAETVQGVTPLHLGSLHANINGIQALFDLRGDKATVSEMVLSKDSAGRLPLHWAARGAHGPEYHYMIPRGEIVTPVANTIKLLLAIDQNSINVKDNQGYNALWYAVSGFRESINQYYDVLKILFEHGADGNTRDQKGLNMLHVLGFTKSGEAIEPVIIERLMAHGANLSDVDIRGNTPLNQMAINLRQVEAVRALIRCGASMKVKNLKGDTPLHQAAHGIVFRYKDGTGIESHDVPLDAKIRAQDEMMKTLEEAGDGLDLMNEKNIEGKTPRQLQEETRNKWRQEEQKRLKRVYIHRLCL
jgi:chitinase